MLYKFQKDQNEKSKWLPTKKARQKICTWKGSKNIINLPKLLQCRILKASNTDVNGQVAKAKVLTTAKYIKFDAWARAGTKRCNVKAGECQMAVNAKVFNRVLYKTATKL